MHVHGWSGCLDNLARRVFPADAGGGGAR
jgi:hypothetical protein